MTPLVSFIVVNYNGGQLLRECLASLESQTLKDCEALVVDNASTDRSWDLPFFQTGNRRLLRLERNTGFAAANNLGFAQSRGEFVALINNDAVLEPDWAANMARRFQAAPQVGAVASRILQQADPGRLDSAGFAYCSCGTTLGWRNYPADYFARREHRPFGAVAAAAMYRRAALERCGLFHDCYFAYYEDTDLAIRLTLHGYDCVYADDAVARHVGSATGRLHSDFHVYHLRRNIEWLYWVDMLGGLAARFYLPHLLYESLAGGGALLHGRGRSALRAKRDAWQARAWALDARKDLVRRLQDSGALPDARSRLLQRMTPWWRGVFNRERWQSWRAAEKTDG